MEKILMGGITGFVLLTLLSYIFLILKIPILIIPTALVGIIFVAKPLIKTVRDIKIKFDFLTIATILVFTIGIIGQMLVISPSGIFKNGDLLFWSANGHDGMWHIALMNEFKSGWPFQNPIFAGEKLVNYHFFSDILPAIVSKYVPISDLDLYFRIFPFFYSLALGASAYFLTKKLTGSKSASLWATIFTYFAGSFGFIVTYIKNKTIGGESIFWATQPQSASGNPPQIISDFLLLTGIYFILLLLDQKDKKKSYLLSTICVIIFGTLVEFKVYAAIVALFSLGITGLWEILKRKDFRIFIVAILSGILSAILYLPNAAGYSSFLIFQPWWYIRTMVVEPSRLNWLDLELKRQFYVARGGVRAILRIIEFEGIAFLIFFFGNLGMRFVGLFNLLKANLLIKLIMIFSFLLPLLFLQKGVASNTSQFLQYFVLLFGLLAGISMSDILSKIRSTIIRTVIVVAAIGIMIPTQVGLLYEFYSRPAFAKVSASELSAIDFVKKNTSKDAVIVTPPYNQYLDLKDSTPNIWDWFDTSYVAALTERRTYMDDYEQVDIMGYNYHPRLEIKKIIFESSDPEKVKNAFLETKANILYFPEIVKPKVDPKKIGLIRIFKNELIEVWKTN